MIEFDMTIRYVSSPADMGAFSIWWLQNMPDGKKIVSRWVTGICIYIGIVCGVGAWLYPSTAFALLIVAIIGMFAASQISPRRIQRNSGRQAVKMYSTPANAGLFGPRTLEINEDGVLSISANGTSLYKWEAFQVITKNETHAFLMVGTVMALVIPKDSVSEGNLDAFVVEAQRLHQQARERVPVAVMAR